MGEIDQMVLPVKKRRLDLTSFPPGIQPKTPFLDFARTRAQNSDPLFTCPRPAKRLCTENRISEFKTPKKERQGEGTDYLWELFHFINADESEVENRVRVFGSFTPGNNVSTETKKNNNESEEENRVSVFGSFAPGSNVSTETKKKNNKKTQAWWKSIVARGRDKFRREKMRLRNANVKDLFSQFRKEEEGFEWQIEHKQDPFAFLSLPVSNTSRV